MLRVLRFILLMTVAWCVMTLTHELGHVVGGWCSGGHLVAAELRPWRLPYSLFSPNPYPLVTLWSGLILGVALPVLAARVVSSAWMWCVAYFCVLANGSYIAVAWLSGDRLLDTAQLLEHGAHPATIVAYCLITIVCGYWGFRRSLLTWLRSPEQPKGSNKNGNL
jgi:hypothetical protein